MNLGGQRCTKKKKQILIEEKKGVERKEVGR